MINPSDLTYEGFFYLPNHRGRPRNERYGHGGEAICATGRGTLLVSGHRTATIPGRTDGTVGALVSEIKVPEEPGGRAEEIVSFFDPTPGDLREDRILHGLDRLGGICKYGDDLLSLSYRYYGVQPVNEIDDPTFGISGRTSLTHVGPKYHPFDQKATSRYLFNFPDWENGSYFTHACGRGDGAGKASSPHGPSLFVFDYQDSEDASCLMYRGEKDALPDWSPCDEWTGGAWLPGTVLFVCRKGIGGKTESWYGQRQAPDGRYDPWNSAKGYHCEKRVVRLSAYNDEDFKKVMNGEADPVDPVPAWEITIPQFHESSQVGSMAWDEEYLYIWENSPPEQTGSIHAGEEPIIHRWKINTAPPPDTEPIPDPMPTEPEKIEVDCTLHVEGYGVLYGKMKFQTEDEAFPSV